MRLKNGAEIRDCCMVARVSMGKDGRTDGVVYFDAEGKEHFQRARAVSCADMRIETPRLLLNSACPGHERGLANSSGTLGKYLMAQAGNVILGRFENLIRMYKAPPAHALTEEFYETDPKRDFARGFAVQTVGPLPIAFAKQMMAAKGVWGWGMRRAMMDYNHWSRLGLLGEILPWEDNRIELAEDAMDGRCTRPFRPARSAGDLRTQRERQEVDRVWQEQGDGDHVGRGRGGSRAGVALCAPGGRVPHEQDAGRRCLRQVRTHAGMCRICLCGWIA